MSTYGTLQSEMQKILNDASFEIGGSNVGYLLIWTNRLIDEIAREINIRDHLANSSLTFTTATHMLAMPSDFLKLSNRFTQVRSDETLVDIVGLDEIHESDPDHDDTTTNAFPDECSIEGNNLYVYPKFAGTIYIENYYKMPTAVTATGVSPDLPYVYLSDDMIVSGVCGKYAFPFLNEMNTGQGMDLTTYYTQRYINLLEQYIKIVAINASTQNVIREYY